MSIAPDDFAFFRDWKPFEALRQQVIPEIVSRRSGLKRIDIWFAASSSGQELYSVAMLIREHFPLLQGWDLQLHASDISQEMLARTSAGRFSTLEVNRGLPAAYLLKYFRREGAEFVIDEALRKLVRPWLMNLAAPWPGLPTMDLVLMRNVLIYFDLPTKRAILERTRKQLRPEGALLLGSAETTLGVCEGWARAEVAGTTIFRLA